MNTRNDTMEKHQGKAAEKLEDRRTFLPAVDVFENKDEVLILADLPGVKTENIAIKFEKDHLTLEGKYGVEGGDGFDYRRTFVVPNGIDSEKIAASLANGVLKVTLPKSAALKPRQIEIKTG